MDNEWRKNVLTKMLESFPFFDNMYVGVASNRGRVDLFKSKLNIPAVGEANRKLLAFYLGTIEGDFVSILKPNVPPREELIALVARLYAYVAIRDSVVSNDQEYGAYMARAKEAMGPENKWFHRCGVHAGGYDTVDSEAYWDSLEAEVSKYNS